MKKPVIYIILWLIACIHCYSHAQNLVPNGNFEQFSGCPTDKGQIIACTGWRNYHLGTCDFFHTCSIGNAHVPKNQFGYQVPVSGNGYAGIYTYDGNDARYREYLTRPIPPLTVGFTYEISFFVSLANQSGYSTSDIGVWFYENGPSATLGSGYAYLNVTPQVSFASYGHITDTTNWVLFKGSFVADSAYSTIVIGSFSKPTDTNQVGTGHGVFPHANAAIYYIDSVVLTSGTAISFVPAKDAFCGEDTIVQPFSVSRVFNVDNVFSLELSDSSGSFNSPWAIGTLAGYSSGIFRSALPSTAVSGLHYRFRIKASSPADSVGPSKYFSITRQLPGNVTAASNAPVCAGQSLHLFASDTTTGVSYKWTGPNNFHDTAQNPSISSAIVSDSGVYIATAFIGGCTTSDTITAGVKQINATVSISVNSPVCENDSLKLKCKVAGSLSLYTWIGPNGFSSSSIDTFILHTGLTAMGYYIFTANFNGCSISDTAYVTVKPAPPDPMAASNSPVCEGGDLILTWQGTSPQAPITCVGPGTFWFNTRSPLFQPVTFGPATASSSGNYIFTADRDGCKISDTITVLVKPLPQKPIGSSNSPLTREQVLKLTVDNIVPDTKYTWKGPAGFYSGAANATLNNTLSQNTGDYIITADREGCTASDTVSVVILDEDDSNFLKLYPNANNGNFTIYAITLKDQVVPFNITSANGQLVYETSIRTDHKLLRTDISFKDGIASGIYTLNIFLDGRKRSIKFVVDRN